MCAISRNTDINASFEVADIYTKKRF